MTEPKTLGDLMDLVDGRDIIDPAVAEALREGRPFSTWRLISVLNHQFRELLDTLHNNVLQPHLEWLEEMKEEK